MQVLEPLALLHITLASGHVLDVAGVDQADLKAAILEDLKQRYPLDPGGLHGHGGDATLLEPVGQFDEIFGERAIMPHRLFIAVCGYCHVVDGGTEVDSGGVRIGSAKSGRSSLPLGSVSLLVGHDAFWCSVRVGAS